LTANNFRVIVASPYWALTGVNIFSANLVRGLLKKDISARILITEQETDRVKISEPLMPVPSDLPVTKLPVRKEDSWARHWETMIRYLEDQAPCIYIPNSDWRHSIVCPKLSNRVAVVGVVHSDDPLHYNHVSRLGRYWNAIVTTSQAIGERVAELEPDLRSRLTTIPIGVPIPGHLPVRSWKADSPLRIIYHGALNQQQKRILDMVEIAEVLSKQNIPFKLTIIGDGAEREELLKQTKPLSEKGAISYHQTLPHHNMLDILTENDAFLMTSAFEGMPNALIEAMGRGCVPVVTDIRSGIPELIQHDQNGYRVPVGNIQMFVEHLAQLQKNTNRRREMSKEAYRTVRNGKFRTEDMIQGYLDLFDRVRYEAKRRRYQRPYGKLHPPPQEVAGISILPGNYEDDIFDTEMAVSWVNKLPYLTPPIKHRLQRLELLLRTRGQV